MQSSLAFFSLQVSNVQFETELVSAITPIKDVIMKLQNTLHALGNTIDNAEKVPKATLTNNLTKVGKNFVFSEFLQIIEEFFVDLEKLLEDQTLTDPRVFDTIAEDIKVVVDYSVQYKIVEAVKRIDEGYFCFKFY